MKVDKIIFGCDDNIGYLDFWKDNSEICKKVLGIEPVLFHITDEETDFYDDDFGIVKKIKKIPNILGSLQAQNIRFYGTKFFENEVCMIGDIDMFLFNKDYLNKIINIPDDDFVIMESDAYNPKRYETLTWRGEGRYYAQYTIGKGKSFNKILDLPNTFENYLERLMLFNFGFATDELYLGHKVDSNFEIKIHKLIRGWMSNFYCPKRIEKANFGAPEGTKLEINDSLILDFFIDCHCPTPYSLYSDKIKTIKNLILSNNEKSINW
jgi:hypothetical protein